MNALVRQLFDGKTSQQINRLCEQADIGRMTVDSWIKQRRTPRVDLLAKVGAAAGFELIFQPRLTASEDRKETTMRTATAIATNPTKYTLVNQDKRINIMINRSRLVGYVEDDTLTALDAQGYAVPVGTINHRAEIIGKLDAWRAAHPHR